MQVYDQSSKILVLKWRYLSVDIATIVFCMAPGIYLRYMIFAASTLTLPMLRLLSFKAQGRKDF